MAKSDYAKAFEELQTIIAKLNSDQIGKDKRAQKLIKACKSKLRNIEEDLHDLFEEEE